MLSKRELLTLLIIVQFAYVFCLLTSVFFCLFLLIPYWPHAGKPDFAVCE